MNQKIIPYRELQTKLKVTFVISVASRKSLYSVCHSGLDPESSLSELDSRFRGNDGLKNNVKKCGTHYIRFCN